MMEVCSSFQQNECPLRSKIDAKPSLHRLNHVVVLYYLKPVSPQPILAGKGKIQPSTFMDLMSRRISVK
jgi:hypothetical protein